MESEMYPTGGGRGVDMTNIDYEDIHISFPKDDLDAAKTAKELIDMKIRKLESLTKKEKQEIVE
jgi:hypothetical protein